MTTFFDLFLQNSSRPEGWADRAFSDTVQDSPFHLWKPGDPIADRGLRLLLGVAPWSGYDMRLLEMIAEMLTSGKASFQPRIDVFNTASCKRQQDFEPYIPSLPIVFHTPLVGVWRNGDLEEAKQGHEARELVARLFDSSSAEIVEFVQDRIKSRT